jgi:hypothetical protein
METGIATRCGGRGRRISGRPGSRARRDGTSTALGPLRLDCSRHREKIRTSDCIGTDAPPTWETRCAARSHAFWRGEIAILVTALAAVNRAVITIDVRWSTRARFATSCVTFRRRGMNDNCEVTIGGDPRFARYARASKRCCGQRGSRCASFLEESLCETDLFC